MNGLTVKKVDKLMRPNREFSQRANNGLIPTTYAGLRALPHLVKIHVTYQRQRSVHNDHSGPAKSVQCQQISYLWTEK
jgi:hypothetical protein